MRIVYTGCVCLIMSSESGGRAEKSDRGFLSGYENRDLAKITEEEKG